MAVNLTFSQQKQQIGAARSPMSLDEPIEPCGDPLADYVSLWMELDRLHTSRRMTTEGWTYLSHQLQKPIEAHLMECRPVNTQGALAALEMADYVMGNCCGEGLNCENAWHLQLCQQLIRSVRIFVHNHSQASSPDPGLGINPEFRSKPKEQAFQNS